MLRDLSNSAGKASLCISAKFFLGAGQQENSDLMDIDGEEAIDNILRDHRKFLDDEKLRDEKYIFDLLKVITNIHESKYYYHNVKTLLPQVWKTFKKEEKNYLAQ
jgi:hypothetical protein